MLRSEPEVSLSCRTASGSNVRTIVVRGRLTCNTDNPTIYNPRYELKPSAG